MSLFQLTQPFIVLDLSYNQIGSEGMNELGHVLINNTVSRIFDSYINKIFFLDLDTQDT
jgi:hypothetical protein